MGSEILAHQETSGLPEKLREEWSEEVVEDGLGPCESVDSPSSWHCAFGKAQVGEPMAAAAGMKESHFFPRK